MKIALCGLWHVHAPGYYKQAKQFSDVIGVWEENEQWRKDFCKENDLYEFNSFEELLESDADGVIVCTSTDIHADVIQKLANAGKDIFTEKVLTLTDEDCKAAAEAIEKNGVRFVISLVHKYSAGLQTVKKIVDSGEIGTVNYLRFKNCHTGSSENWLPKHFYDLKQCGGGAMIDLGAHGMYITDWILGQPNKYTSVFTNASINEGANALNTDKVEDHAVTVMSYENGAIAVNETGFVSLGCPLSIEVGGDKGFVRFDSSNVIKNTLDTGKKAVEVEMEKALPSPLEQFLTGNVLEGCGIREALNLTHMMVEAYANRI